MTKKQIKLIYSPYLFLFLALNTQVLKAEKIDGVYSRLSLTNIRTGQSPEAIDRQGLLIMTEGYYALMTQNADRHLLVKIDSPSMKEKIIILSHGSQSTHTVADIRSRVIH